ncbi:MAG: hypothetical protein NTW07_10305, partial [candidate division Zixibacteria bacterium]|nr:hypothetical protein [candidate division Zixibacteria bacterium]
WHAAPLKRDGTVTDAYEVIKNFNEGIEAVGFDDINAAPKICILVNRMYYWLRETGSKKEFAYLPRLLNETASGFCRDLMRLRLDYGIRENRDYSTLKQYTTIFVPSAEVMPEKDQEAIVELAKAGVTIIMCGLMPKYDENFRECQILAKHFRIQTTVDQSVETISHKGGEFAAFGYGSIRTADERAKKLAKSDGKVVGVCSTRFKGSLYFLSFDLASGGDYSKLSFVASILEATGNKSFLYCSDPSVNLAFHMGSKHGLLFVVAPPPGELSDGLEATHKEVIIQADLRQAGFGSAKIKLTNIFESAETTTPIKTTAKDLKAGLVLPIRFPDGMIFRIEKA